MNKLLLLAMALALVLVVVVGYFSLAPANDIQPTVSGAVTVSPSGGGSAGSNKTSTTSLDSLPDMVGGC
jgi:uncharacterized transporter YbjL